MGNIKLRRVRKVSTFRRLAVAAWGASRDPTIHGSIEVDASPALAHLAELHARAGEHATLTHTFNLKLPGLPRDSFGSAAVTNVGMFGARWAYAPLFPPAHCPIVVLVGAVTPRPWVVAGPDGALQVAVRPVLPLHATLDHRVLDGVQAARLAARLEELLADPRQLELPGGGT